MAKSKRAAMATQPPSAPSASSEPALAQSSAAPTSAPATSAPAIKAAVATAESEYIVVARRYRPQQFADLVGQEAQAKALMQALESGRVAHAYLFTGARGVGKTSTARILAKALNCVTGPTPRPCGVCESCQAIATGEDIDVLEIDGASNRGIDEVRAIRQNVTIRPARSRYKIYIIDEVHMLTTQAFNALLKTLEEPPPHVKFILATTEAQRIPVTILSRCQRFDFGTISTSKIRDRLRQIVQAEAMQADDQVLELIARRAAGSMRDAQSLLEQLLAFRSDRLTVGQVHALLGTADQGRVAAIAQAVLVKDLPGVLRLVQQAADDGLQLGELLDQLISWWRDLMVVVCVNAQPDQLDKLDMTVSATYRAQLLEQTRQLTLDTVLTGLDILANARQRMRGSNHGRVLLETALVRLGRLDELLPVGQLLQQLSNPAAQSAPVRSGQSVLSLSGQADEAEKKQPLASPTQPDQLRASHSAPPTNNRHSRPDATAQPPGQLATVAVRPELTDQTIAQEWPKILDRIGGLLGNDLARGEVAISGPKALVIRFPKQYADAYENCMRPSSLVRIEKALNETFASPMTVRLELTHTSIPRADQHPHPDQASMQQLVQRLPLDTTDQRGYPPLVKKAIELFAARVLKVDDGFGQASTGQPRQREDA